MKAVRAETANKSPAAGPLRWKACSTPVAELGLALNGRKGKPTYVGVEFPALTQLNLLEGRQAVWSVSFLVTRTEMWPKDALLLLSTVPQSQSYEDLIFIVSDKRGDVKIICTAHLASLEHMDCKGHSQLKKAPSQR